MEASDGELALALAAALGSDFPLCSVEVQAKGMARVNQHQAAAAAAAAARAPGLGAPPPHFLPLGPAAGQALGGDSAVAAANGGGSAGREDLDAALTRLLETAGEDGGKLLEDSGDLGLISELKLLKAQPRF